MCMQACEPDMDAGRHGAQPGQTLAHASTHAHAIQARLGCWASWCTSRPNIASCHAGLQSARAGTRCVVLTGPHASRQSTPWTCYAARPSPFALQAPEPFRTTGTAAWKRRAPHAVGTPLSKPPVRRSGMLHGVQPAAADCSRSIRRRLMVLTPADERLLRRPSMCWKAG